MNEAELDRLLDAWEAPEPPASLRAGLRARFPRAERRRFAGPLRWGLAIAILTVALAGMAQTGADSRDNPLVGVLTHLYSHFLRGLELRRGASIANQIRQSNPRVYVDGQAAAPLEYAPASRMDVQVPGEGVFSLVPYRMPPDSGGWIEAGRIHENAIEFRARGRRVRIVCDKPIVDSDLPVFVRQRP